MNAENSIIIRKKYPQINETPTFLVFFEIGKTIRMTRKKVQYLIDSLRTNPAESERIGLNLYTAKLANNHVTPKHLDEKLKVWT